MQVYKLKTGQILENSTVNLRHSRFQDYVDINTAVRA